jgi:hypothetical protein
MAVGEFDVVVVYEAPDDTAAASLVWRGGWRGGARRPDHQAAHWPGVGRLAEGGTNRGAALQPRALAPSHTEIQSPRTDGRHTWPKPIG